MTDTTTGYEFCVQIWNDGDRWDYGIVQEFDGEEPEVLAYGFADTLEEAAALVGEQIKGLF